LKKIRKPTRRAAPRGRKVFGELVGLITEKVNPRSKNLDTLSTLAVLRLINREDASIARAVSKEIPYIARAVEMAVKALKGGGRIIYVGAGTSGRLGVLDASECPPTFGISPKTVRGIIAGGYPSLILSKEGAEDNISAAIRDIRKIKANKNDLVIGITASRRTPFVLAALNEAQRLGASTVFICCNPRRLAPKQYDLAICPVVGPEVIAGSSRMKAGTSQKMILNMITTTTMVRTGRVFGNRMVDLRATSEKLKERSKKVIMDICDVTYSRAANLLKQADGSVKTALVMFLAACNKNQALGLLSQSDGFVKAALRLHNKINTKPLN
jgi:N-acetylmuramic acid 6-phosphate etherase